MDSELLPLLLLKKTQAASFFHLFPLQVFAAMLLSTYLLPTGWTDNAAVFEVYFQKKLKKFTAVFHCIHSPLFAYLPVKVMENS